MNRADQLIRKMALENDEAVLLTKPSNIFYVSGFTGEGKLLVAQGLCAIVTDFRYVEQAAREAPESTVEMTEKGVGHDDLLRKLCQERSIRTLYYEDDDVTVRAFSQLQRKLGQLDYRAVAGMPEKMRQSKDESELAAIREACRITGEAFERVLPLICEGMTERELQLALEREMILLGSPKPAFDTIVASGANGSLPHAKPSDKKLEKGDMITMDFGATYMGYCADMTRTVALGQPSDEMRRVYDVVYEAQRMAQDALMAGKQCTDIDKLARDYIYSHGYEGRFGHGLGHSLGIEIHEEPRLSQLSTDRCEVGQLLTVEPGVYLPGVGGVRIENTCVVLEGGCEALTLPRRDLIIL